MLLALSTSQRIQTLSKIFLENIIISIDVIQIKIPGRIKTSKVNYPQPCLIIPYFIDQPELCVASTLQSYINKTAALRNTITNLFITFKKPFRDATKQTLSRWVKIVLNFSGVDTNVFKPHSTRP